MTIAAEPTFDAAMYDLNIPKLDDRKATDLELRFSGSGKLDRTNEDDLELLEAARIGAPVRLIVTGEVVGKSFRLVRTSDAEGLAYACTVKVISVEAGELA